MSAINFRFRVDKKEDPTDPEEWVVITLEGKFLPYKKW
jgi:cyanate lyase